MIAILSFATLVAAQSTSYGCPPDGPLLPKPINLTNSSFVRNATNTLQNLLDRVVERNFISGWVVDNTSFSAALVSFDDPNPNIPAWEYHHCGSANTKGVEIVDGETQYLVGSISKLFSDLLLLKTGIDLDDPVTRHLPELNSSDTKIDWNDITLAALADHLSGIPPNYGFSEFYFLKDVFELLGFPQLTEDDYGKCGITGLNTACTQEGMYCSYCES
jgi:CubicO group peptidase (beta-lactamase class C family)